MREDEYGEFKKAADELNGAMVSISGILNKHRRGADQHQEHRYRLYDRIFGNRQKKAAAVRSG